MESRWTSDEQDAIREQAERRAEERAQANELPKRRPGTHWTGPSGEHVEVPITPRTLSNLQRTLRTIT